MRLLVFAVTGLSLIFMQGCAAKKLNNGARKVRIVTSQPNEDRCEYLGEVVGEQGNFFTGKWTSNANLEQGSMNDMKNKAAELGGNTVHMINRAQGSKGQMGNGWGSSYKNDVQNIGAVYDCQRKKRSRKTARK